MAGYTSSSIPVSCEQSCTAPYIDCRQCPRKCTINRAEKKHGFCGETDEVRAALACLHFGEEPPIAVTGGSGTIFLTGCTLRCAFCQNYQISQGGYGKSLSSDDFSHICLKLQDAGAENINLVTGSHCIPHLAEYIFNAQQNGCEIPFCWNSSAYESVEMLNLLKPLVKIWLPDLKTTNSALSKKLFGAEDYPDVAKSAILWMIQNFPPKIEKKQDDMEKPTEKMLEGVVVRHLFLPGHFAETVEVLSWLKENADGRAYISLMNQYTPVDFKEGKKVHEKRMSSLSVIENRLVSEEEDADLRDLIDIYDFENLFYQELSDDTSWLPDFTKPQVFPNALSKTIWHC